VLPAGRGGDVWGYAVAVATGDIGEVREARATPRRGTWRTRAGVLAVVALVVAPIAIAALAQVGTTWLPVGDWASMAYRTSRVGTSDTPLVGAYTVKGWAHPGPLLFWLAAPLFRLTGGDARALEWTAAILNAATICAIAAVAWRRGRWPLLLGVMAMTAVLVHAIGPDLLVDLWNPYAPLLPFVLTILLVWDAALGRRRAVVEAAVPACFAMQCHLAFVSLVALLAVFVWAWSRWWPRLLPADEAAAAELPRPPWGHWWRAALAALGITAVLSVGPLLDAVFDMHNPARIARSFGSGAARLGPLEGLDLLGRFVRPDGAWMGGPEPISTELSVIGSGPLPVVLVVALLGACLHLGRRRGLVDVVALTSLTITLVLGSIPAASQFVLPVERYLTQWLKIVGALTWFAVGWTAWRLAEPALRAVPRRRAAAAAMAVAALVGLSAWSWPEATRAEPQFPDEGRIVAELGVQLAPLVEEGEVVRIERRGEPWHIFTPGLVYDLIQRGVDVTTGDGGSGLKWGHEHRWVAGEPYDRLWTVAVHDAGAWHDAVAECERVASVDKIAEYDALSPADRDWLEDLQLRRLDDPSSITPDEDARATELGRIDLRIAVFEGPAPCADDESLIDGD
jgi:hypothetical protein